ncbi:carboxymuconolactone decarboxylase family protein [Roseomonas eburnea]|uniref:Carboxymuconolactone decarboxylase family protein n=1 Tax=Neoroseomonas eburnea TaxID=1346889 RepID=A0A9X9XCX8_9PROT|nr:carboxymuconolactone decarboxylase family protein [Neoroseomonas eburnea]MBR0681564.1 carboxymuconolactone decarboxylase family protein [Neoroseomonas eburnea]
MSGRFPPLPREALDDAQRAVFDAIASGPRGAVGGPFTVLLRAPAMADAVQHLGASLRFAGLLDDRLREIAILTVSRHWSAQYEWFAHHPIALKAGVDAEALGRLLQRQDPQFADVTEQLVWRISQAVLEHGRLDDSEFAMARDTLGEARLVELLGVLGYYTLLSFILNVGQVPVPSPLPFPEAP